MSDSTEHTLRLASKTLQKTGFILIPLSMLPILVIDPPLDGVSFPEHIVLIARILAVTSLAGVMLSAVVFLFYRKRKKVYLNEQGIQFPMYPFIPWKRIQWYKIHIISNYGLNGMKLNTDYGKVVITAEDDEALYHFKEDFEEKVKRYNPSAQDFRELKSSKVKAIIFSILTTLVFLALYLLFKPGMIGLISIPILIICIWAIWIEHIKIAK